MTEFPEVASSTSEDAPSPSTDVSTVRGDILTDLQTHRTKIGEGADPVFLNVPGYDGKLVLKVRWIPLKTLGRTGPELIKIKEPTAQTEAAAADAIVATCEEIMVRVDEGEGLTIQPLSTNDIPVTFGDSRVAYALGFPAPKDARTMVVRTFKNEYALIDMANEITEWLEDTSRAINAQYTGE